MIAAVTCVVCGAEVLPGAVDGHCARCLFKLGLEFSEQPAGFEVVDLTPLLARAHSALSVKFHRLGDYELLEEIGRGGMGVVFRARQISLNRPVALKLILGGQLASPTTIKRFQVEAEAAARLHHPNVVAVYETGERDGYPFYSMELVDGVGLERRTSEFQMGSPEAAGLSSEGRGQARRCQQAIARFLRSVALAVDYAHRRGVLHRDLKPGNIIVDREGRPHLTDFGLAKFVHDEQTQFTLTGAMLGTPNYMAPELAAGHAHQATTAADIYSLGAIFYEMLTGAPPFQAATPVEIWRRALEEEPRNPSATNSLIHPDLATICLRCLEKEPQRRYTSAGALGEDLERWLAGEPIAARPIGAGEKLWRWCRRKPALAALSALAMMLCLAGVIGVSTQWQRAEREARTTHLNLYAADMGSAQQALREGNVGRARQLLDAYQSPVGGEDLRGFEWRLLRQAALGEYELAFVGHTNAVRSLAFSPDDHWLVTASGESVIKVWDVTRSAFSRLLLGHTGAVNTVAFSPDSKMLATASQDGTIKLWDTSTWQVTTQLVCRPPPYQVAFSPTEPLLAFSEGGGVNITIGRIHLWNYVTGTRVRTWKESGNRFAFSPDGRKLVAGNLDRIAIWDMATGRNLWRDRQPSSALSLVVSPKGDKFAAASFQGDVRVFDLEEPERSYTLRGTLSRTRGVAFTPDGVYLAGASGDQTVRIWNVSSWERTNLAPRTLWGHGSGVRCLEFSHQGKLLASGDKDGVVLLWNTKARPAQTLITNVLTTYTNPLPVFSRDSKLMATMSAIDEVGLWDLQSVTRLQSFPGVRIPLAISEDHRTLTALSASYALQCWDLTNGNLRREEQFVPGKNAFTGKLSPDEKVLAVGYLDGTFSLWDLSTRTELIHHRGHRTNVREFAFAPDGRRLATASQDNTAKLWDVRSGQELATLSGHGDEVWTIAFAPDGSSVATGSSDHTVRLWAVPSGRLLATLTGHKEGVFRVAFAPDGRTLATASDDNTVRLWHLATRREVARLDHDSDVVSVSFTPDGEALVSSAHRRVMQVFRAPSFATLEEAARRKTVRE